MLDRNQITYDSIRSIQDVTPWYKTMVKHFWILATVQVVACFSTNTWLMWIGLGCSMSSLIIILWSLRKLVPFLASSEATVLHAEITQVKRIARHIILFWTVLYGSALFTLQVFMLTSSVALGSGKVDYPLLFPLVMIGAPTLFLIVDSEIKLNDPRYWMMYDSQPSDGRFIRPMRLRSLPPILGVAVAFLLVYFGLNLPPRHPRIYNSDRTVDFEALLILVFAPVSFGYYFAVALGIKLLRIIGFREA